MIKFRSLRVLAPTLLVLIGLAALATAQTFTRAIQLSQDTTGAFLVDSTNNIYFPAHINVTGNPRPTVTGTGTPTISGTDAGGVITMGTSATTATMVFGRAYLTVPFCVLVSASAIATTPIAYVAATTSVAITQVATSANRINYFCTSLS